MKKIALAKTPWMKELFFSDSNIKVVIIQKGTALGKSICLYFNEKNN